MRSPICRAWTGTGLPMGRVAAALSVACGAILELGVYHDADKGDSGSPAIGLALHRFGTWGTRTRLTPR